MQRKSFALFFFGFAVLAMIPSISRADTSTAAEIQDAKDRLGVYYWGGSAAGISGSKTIPSAAEYAKKLGTHAIRITLSPLSDAIYYGNQSCLPSFSLASLARRPDFDSILRDPQFTTIVINAYDGTSFQNCTEKRYLNPAYLTNDALEKIELEYGELAQYLSQFESKKFIITNREGDNEIYCGAASTAKASTCPGYEARIEALKKWFTARHNGIRASNADNVYSGIEFNIVRSLRNNGLPNVLFNIIPYVPSDYQLYSAYESINVNTDRLRQDIDLIRESGATDLLIGDFGYSSDSSGDKLANAAKVLREKNIPMGIIWGLYSSGGFGLIDTDGSIKTSAKRIFGEPAEDKKQVTSQKTTLGIGQIRSYDQYRDSYSDSAMYAKRYVTLFGTFAPRDNKVFVGDTAYTPTYQSSGQINFLLGPATGTKAIVVKSPQGETPSRRIVVEDAVPYIPRPTVRDAKSFNAATKEYSTVFKKGATIVLYGNFADSGNKATVNGTPVKITSESASEIRISLPAAASAQTRISITNSAGTSESYAITLLEEKTEQARQFSASQNSASGTLKITRIRAWDAGSKSYARYAYPGMYLVLNGFFPQDGNVSVAIDGAAVTPERKTSAMITIPLNVSLGDHTLTVSSPSGGLEPIKIHVGN